MCATTVMSSDAGWMRTSTKLNGAGWAATGAAIPMQVAATERRTSRASVFKTLNGNVEAKLFHSTVRDRAGKRCQCRTFASNGQVIRASPSTATCPSRN